MRASEFLTELRDRMFQYIKSLLPTWPDYVLKDWIYGLARGDHQAGVYFKPDADFGRWGFNRETVFKMIADAGLSPDTKWQLIPNMKFTMDMFEPNSKRKLIGRAGGSSDMGMGIPKDAERHATQAALAQQQGGIRKEPVILIKTPQGYELLEGWHRTIQHFARYPDGYVGPAYVAVAQSKPGITESMAADQVLDYVKRTHAPEEFDIEYSITDHPEWELKTIPLSQLNLDPDGETPDPYNRVNWVDYDKVQELILRIESVLKSNPIVVDPAGWIIDGNHRAMAAVEAGLTSVPALVPAKQGVAEGTEQKPVVIYTNHRGATIDDDIKKSLRTTQEPFNKLQMWEKHKSMKDPKIADWVTNKLLPELKQNGVLKPLLVWNNNGQLFVIDGNHRFLAYQEAGYRGRVPVQIVPDNMIIVSDTVPGQQGVVENFADGRVKGKSRPGRVKRAGASCDGSVTDLRRRAKKASGEKARMYHWCANMKSGRKKTNETTVGVLTLGEFTVNIDDHALDRAQERRIKSTDIDTVLRKIKLPRVIKQVMALDLGSRFYVLDHSSNVALGFRRIGDKKLVLKTVYPGRPMDHNIATIITI